MIESSSLLEKYALKLEKTQSRIGKIVKQKSVNIILKNSGLKVIKISRDILQVLYIKSNLSNIVNMNYVHNMLSIILLSHMLTLNILLVYTRVFFKQFFFFANFQQYVFSQFCTKR